MNVDMPATIAAREVLERDPPPRVSVVMPARNEAFGLAKILPALKAVLPDAEVIVVDDGSTDGTAEVCGSHGVRRLHHLYAMGNGAAIKAGARAARGEIIVFMDADTQHRPEDIPRLLNRLEEGYDMVVGARSAASQASFGRLAANTFYNRFASLMVGKPIADLTSGFRVVRAELFREFLHLLPNGFSYPTTTTMAFFRSGYAVAFEPIVTEERVGRSHIRLARDGVRFLLILFKIGTLYSPLKIFLPVSLSLFLVGASYYAHTYMTEGRFTNMSALLFIACILVFLIGLVSEQITMLLYQQNQKR